MRVHVQVKGFHLLTSEETRGSYMVTFNPEYMPSDGPVVLGMARFRRKFPAWEITWISAHPVPCPVDCEFPRG